MFQHILGWIGLNRTKNNHKTQQRPVFGGQRRLRLEPLEDRRMLATLTVNVNDDGAIDIDDGNLTLREAIAYVNGDAFPDLPDQAHITGTIGVPGVPDIILFDSGLDGVPIMLDYDEQGFGFNRTPLNITAAMTIDAQGQNITIDASLNDFTPGVNDGEGASVFTIVLSASSDPQEVEFIGLTITGADTSVEGGGILFHGSASTKLTVRDSPMLAA